MSNFVAAIKAATSPTVTPTNYAHSA
jgi:hypothetical protein